MPLNSCWALRPSPPVVFQRKRPPQSGEQRRCPLLGGAYGPADRFSPASEFLQFRQRLGKRMLTYFAFGIPGKLENMGQRRQRVALFALPRHEPQIFARSAGAVRFPESLALKEGNSRPVRQMYRFTPVAPARGCPSFRKPDRP